jgi:hypothetical protein
MELRYTLEILTKDIQDIEKLVGNLQNSAGAYSIELDLALSKLRNVYEVLTMIKADRLQEMVSQAPTGPVATPGFSSSEPEAQQEPADTVHETMDVSGPGKKKERVILAEKFSAESSVNENLGGKRIAGKETRLVGQPIDSIHKNIGINDRFLIIRELFEGNADGFRELIQQLDEAGNYLKATELLKKRFPESGEHEGIEILEGLIKRRFAEV